MRYCIICGIKEGFALKETCEEEVKIFGIELIEIPEVKKPHIWVEEIRKAMTTEEGK